MNFERYQQLRDQLLDGELSTASAEELAAGLRKHPDFQQDLRRHLALWEAWSQRLTEARSTENFVEAWKTRACAEDKAEEFSLSVMERIQAQTGGAMHRISFWKRLLRPLPIAATLLAAAVMASWRIADRISQARTLRDNAAYLAQTGVDRLVTISGEGACAWCVLREGPPQRPALRMKTDSGTRIVYLQFKGYTQELHRYFEGGTTVLAKGFLREDHGRLVLKTQSIEIGKVEHP